MKEYINPLDIPYQYQHYTRKGQYAHREAADPTLVLFKGRYYCFASMSGGFYYSDDLARWRWHKNPQLDMYRYAPDAREIDGWLYFCASSKDTPSVIRRTQDPLSDCFETVSMPFDFWDPDLFVDDDGRVYLYWGCNDQEPIYGVELDRQTMMPIGEKTALITEDCAHRGWERSCSQDQPTAEQVSSGEKPFIEGAFMTRVGDVYYLQYAAPGTQMASYGDGVFTGSSPLGPFVFQSNIPFSYRPSGFLTGAGHGSTVADKAGNLWHMATSRISVNRDFERRISLFPAGVDEDQVLYCNQRFADYPYVIPEGPFCAEALNPPYMLLSYMKKAWASSALPGHEPWRALNEDIRTWWATETSAGAWFCLDLGRPCSVHSVPLNFADHELPLLDLSVRETGPAATRSRFIDLDPGLHTRYTLEGSLDGESWVMLEDASRREEDRCHPYLILPEDRLLRFFRVTAVERPYGGRMALSGVRVFGVDPAESLPGAVEDFVSSCADGGMTCRLAWPEAEGAEGYNVCFGIAPDKLYHSCQVFGRRETVLTACNTQVRYWCRIDSFNSRGVTQGKTLPLG